MNTFIKTTGCNKYKYNTKFAKFMNTFLTNASMQQ